MLPSAYSTAWSNEATVCCEVPAAVKVTSRALRFARTMTPARPKGQMPQSSSKTAASLVLTGRLLAAGGNPAAERQPDCREGILPSYLAGKPVKRRPARVFNRHNESGERVIRLGLCCIFRDEPIKFVGTTATAV